MRNLENELKNKTINHKKAEKYTQKTKKLDEQFEMIVDIENNKMTSKLIDIANEEEYILADIKESTGKFAGLTDREVEERKKAKLVNIEVKPPSKSALEIIGTNIFTYFNFIFAFIAIILIMVKSYRDLTFLPVIISNTVIGIVQELRSKKVLDRLKMLNAPFAMVIRNGEEKKIQAKELVKDDIVIFKAGDQICADAMVLEGEVSVNESLLTGESDEIIKTRESKLMSGSFVVSGSCLAKLTNVGEESYISKLTLQAKKMKNEEQSEMIRSLNRIVKFAGIIIIPIGAALFIEQYKLEGAPLKSCVQSMVAAVIGMIPEGLFLLASVTLAISAMKLAKNKVLIHDMKCIETLARVDVLCVDKTGTITDGNMKVSEILPLEDYEGSREDLEILISDFACAQEPDNITMEAVKKYFTKNTNKKAISVVGFSSKFKYSGVAFEKEAFILGAPEFLLKEKYERYKSEIEKYSKKGERVLVFCKYNGILDGKEITNSIIPYGLIMISNSIRESATETFKFFTKQGVNVKVISGDSPITVSQVAKKAGIENAENYIDASLLKNDEEIEIAAKKYNVFGRVTPDQKRKIIRALKKSGRTVAMTGDGVNDVLALKDADCSIAMASGSQAAVQASQLVLLESDFSKMPGVVEEGRRVVNNLERSGSLFLVKNIFSLFISILAICFNVTYPLKPSQVSLISMFTIGLPAFLLSQAPNKELIKGKFIKNIISKSLPGGLTDTLVVLIMVVLGNAFMLTSSEISTASTFLLAIVGLIILYRASKPMTIYKWFILGICAVGLILSIIFFKNLFGLTELSVRGFWVCISVAFFTEVIFKCLTYFSREQIEW